MADWLAAFRLGDGDGRALSPDAVPLVAALRGVGAVHRRLTITGIDGVRRTIEATAFPLVGQGGRVLGAMTIFWPAP